MKLLQSVIANAYPSITTLLKFWINQLINLVVNILTTYPINTLLIVLILVTIVYRLLSKLLGQKMFKAKYKPLKHKQNLTNDAKLIKK
jgi:hypothetical protein